MYSPNNAELLEMREHSHHEIEEKQRALAALTQPAQPAVSRRTPSGGFNKTPKKPPPPPAGFNKTPAQPPPASPASGGVNKAPTEPTPATPAAASGNADELTSASAAATLAQEQQPAATPHQASSETASITRKEVVVSLPNAAAVHGLRLSLGDSTAVTVEHVLRGSLAEAAGIIAGDEVYEWSGLRVQGKGRGGMAEALLQMYTQAYDATDIVVKLMRDASVWEAAASAEKPAAPPAAQPSAGPAPAPASAPASAPVATDHVATSEPATAPAQPHTLVPVQAVSQLAPPPPAYVLPEPVDRAMIARKEKELQTALIMAEEVAEMLDDTDETDEAHDPDEKNELLEMARHLEEKAMSVGEELDALKSKAAEYEKAKAAAEAAEKAAADAAEEAARLARASAEAPPTPVTTQAPPPPSPAAKLEVHIPPRAAGSGIQVLDVDPTASAHMQELQSLHNDLLQILAEAEDAEHRQIAEASLAEVLQQIEQEKLHGPQTAAQPLAVQLEAAAPVEGQYTVSLHPQEGIGFGMRIDVVTVSGVDHVAVSEIQPGGPAGLAGMVDGDVVAGMAGNALPFSLSPSLPLCLPL